LVFVECGAGIEQIREEQIQSPFRFALLRVEECGIRFLDLVVHNGPE
jgi:hypothetical protein